MIIVCGNETFNYSKYSELLRKYLPYKELRTILYDDFGNEIVLDSGWYCFTVLPSVLNDLEVSIKYILSNMDAVHKNMFLSILSVSQYFEQAITFYYEEK